jgi:soluble lytic murein transglycosylase
MRLLAIASVCTAIAAASFCAPALALAPKSMTPEEAMLAARDAFLAGDRAKLARVAGKLKDHVLEPYVEYWQLSLRLKDVTPDQARDFLARNSDTAVAEQFRGDWLKVLGRNRQWDLFLAEYPAFSGDDPDLACYALQARWEREDPSLPADFRAFWNSPRELPEPCIPVAKALRKSGALDARDVWARFRLLTDADAWSAAVRLMDLLPRGEALDAKRIRAVARAPIRFLKSLHADLARVAERELVIAALAEAADDDPRTTVAFWDGKLSAAFPPEDRVYVWKLLAMQGALSHVPEALDWFDRAGEVALTDQELAWRARSALRQEKWTEVKKSIERMSPLAKNDPAWIYWSGRAEQALGNPIEAQGYFGLIAAEHSFYGRLAAEELGMSFQIPPRAAEPSAEEIAEVMTVPGIRRSLALYRADLRTEGTREWIWSIRGMDDRHLLAAAEVASWNEVWDRAINTADRTVAAHDFSVRYLAPYRELLAQKARSRELDESWVLGLVRQESRFIADAQSNVGATGLMQVMRSTAKWAAQKNGIRRFPWSRLSEPDFNATLGTTYLRHMLDQFDGNPVLAAAAYNAGPSRARKWRGTKPLEGAVYVETIPFGETRDYVKKVMANTVYYAAILGGAPTSLKARLGTIPARSAGDGVVAMKGAQAM